MGKKINDWLLKIDNLSVNFQSQNEPPTVGTRCVNLSVAKGKITALVGESGSGKSVTALSIMDLLPDNGIIIQGEIHLSGKDIGSMASGARRKFLTKEAAMIFQDPFSALDPLYTVKYQLMEAIKIHFPGISKYQAREKMIEILCKMNFLHPEEILKKYPFQLSGGMCQRIMIAMAMLGEPKLLIADEPTTALDVTVQSKILSEIQFLQQEMDMGVLLITHDLGVVAEIADDVFIIKDGCTVEYGNVYQIFHCPQHEYTRSLIGAVKKLPLEDKLCSNH
jgi:ABC-type dipeptide/oligopeptide/nickel transport system ATPase component